MSHLHLVQAAAPIFKQNVDGGVYLMTSSIAVSRSALSRTSFGEGSKFTMKGNFEHGQQHGIRCDESRWTSGNETCGF